MMQQKPVRKKTTKKSGNPADSYPSRKGTIGGGEGTNPPFKSRKGTPYAPTTYGGAKNGKTIKKAQFGSLIKKGVKKVVGEAKAIKSGVKEGVKEYKATKFTNKLKNWKEGDKIPKMPNGMGFKTGGKVSKAKNGTSLGMKSVKAGYDKNPGVTRADIITAAKGKAKSGASMTKCKYGCK